MTSPAQGDDGTECSNKTIRGRQSFSKMQEQIQKLIMGGNVVDPIPECLVGAAKGWNIGKQFSEDRRHKETAVRLCHRIQKQFRDIYDGSFGLPHCDMVVHGVVKQVNQVMLGCACVVKEICGRSRIPNAGSVFWWRLHNGNVAIDVRLTVESNHGLESGGSRQWDSGTGTAEPAPNFSLRALVTCELVTVEV